MGEFWPPFIPGDSRTEAMDHTSIWGNTIYVLTIVGSETQEWGNATPIGDKCESE